MQLDNLFFYLVHCRATSRAGAYISRRGANVSGSSSTGGKDIGSGGTVVSSAGLAPTSGGKIVWAAIWAGVAREGGLADVAKAATAGGLLCRRDRASQQTNKINRGRRTKASRPLETERSNGMVVVS